MRRAARPSASTRRPGWTTATRRSASSRRWPSRPSQWPMARARTARYFGGCSNGGRHTLVAAARYADDYDGYLAGAPGYNLPLAALANIFGAQRYATVATGNPATPAGLETAFTTAERKTRGRRGAGALRRARWRQRRPDPGHEHLPARIRPGARRAHLRRRARRHLPVAGAEDRHRTDLQRRHHERAAQPFYAAFPFDSGIGGGGIPFWEFTAPLVLDSGAVGVIFKVPPSTRPLEQRAGLLAQPEHRPDAGRVVRHQRHLHRSGDELHDAAECAPTWTTCATAAPRCSSTTASAIRSSRSTTPSTWYRGIDRCQRRRADEFARLYPVPGMGHCSGGPATDQADFITPLVALGRARRRARRHHRHGARPRQCRRRERRGAGRLGARPDPSAVPLPDGGALRGHGQPGFRRPLRLPLSLLNPGKLRDWPVAAA